MEDANAKSRNVLVDLARVICAVLVIVVHTRPWVDTDFYFGYFLSNVVARLAVPLFFLLAGYFLCEKLKKEEHPADYLKKYLFNLCRIYIVWSAVYFPYDFNLLLERGNSYGQAAGIYLRHFFIYGGHFYLWFFPALAYASAIAGIFYIKKKMKLLYVPAVIFYVAGLLAEPYLGWFGNLPGFVYLSDIVCQLGTSRSALFFALPFIVLGFLGGQNVLPKAGNKILMAGFMFFLLLLSLESFFLQSLRSSGGYNLYTFLPAAAYFAFLLLMKNSADLRGFNSRNLRDLSLLMYCSHGIFLIFAEEYLPWKFDNLGRFLICLSSTLAFSVLALRCGFVRKILA